MSRKKIVIFFICLIFVIVIVLFFGLSRTKKAGLLVETTPISEVFVNGKSVGKTPLNISVTQGEILLKLIPDSQNSFVFERKINLAGGIKTVVKRNIGNEDNSYGEIISFERVTRGEVSISVVTKPDSAEIRLDDETKGFAPIKIIGETPGIHKLEVSAGGYISEAFNINAIDSYKLTAVVDLAKIKVETSSTSSAEVKSASIEAGVKFVEILTTPTGFLRVRTEPTTVSPEVAKVDPGKKFKLLEQNSKEGWFKIDLGEGKSGWVSDEYATVSGEIKSN